MGIPCISSGPQWCIGGYRASVFAGFKCLDPPEAVRQRIASLQSTARGRRRYNIILWPFHACCVVLHSSMFIFYWSAVFTLREVAGLLHHLHIYFFSQPLLLSFSDCRVNTCRIFTPKVFNELYFCVYMHLSICKESLKKPKKPS